MSRTILQVSHFMNSRKLSLSDTAFNAAVFAYDKSLSGSAIVQPRPMHAVHVIALRAALEAALAAAGTESLYGHKPGCPPAPAACICASGTEPTLTDEQIDAINSIEFRNHVHAALSAFAEIVIENKGNWFDSSGRNLVDAILRNARKPLALALFRAPSECAIDPGLLNTVCLRGTKSCWVTHRAPSEAKPTCNCNVQHFVGCALSRQQQ